MNKTIFKGSCPALITPFKNGAVDFDAFKKLINLVIDNGSKAILVLGTTGEPCTMSEEEKVEVIKFAKKVVAKRAKLIVGTGGNSTKKVIFDTLRAKSLGADCALVVTPYYNKCTQKGLIKHYQTIMEQTNFPIILYNVPGRTGVNLLPQSVLELSKNKNCVGVKEASGNISQICELFNLCDDKFAIYCGDDALTYTFLTLGASGVISVSANCLPQKIATLCNLCFEKNFEEAKSIHNNLFNLNKALFYEVNPIPIKALCAHLGFCNGELRPPLTQMEKANFDKLLEEYNKVLS